jgi:hypothetical protein
LNAAGFQEKETTMSKISDLIAKLPCSPEYDSFLDELDATGWQLVPKEPTDAMMQAGLYQSSHDSQWGDLYQGYKDMLAAAPKVS